MESCITCRGGPTLKSHFDVLSWIKGSRRSWSQFFLQTASSLAANGYFSP
jgi:hypothetical protein